MTRTIDDWQTDKLRGGDWYWHDTKGISDKAKLMGFLARHLKESRHRPDVKTRNNGDGTRSRRLKL